MFLGGNLMNFKPLLILPFLFLVVSCGSSERALEIKEREIQHIDDHYRNFYEIFPISFADSNGDGKGDLQGIIDKFDYIKSLNMNGLWLTPVHPSDSYHKYDVKDYKNIDSTFGSLATYDALVKKCHDNNMEIILDLVLNHSSVDHPWFQQAINAHINNNTSNKYYNYYVIKPYTGTVPQGYARYGNSNYIYECPFWSGMPDFNIESILDGSNTALMDDFRDIAKFWLVDHKVDGFRLDAVTSYVSDDTEKNCQFLNWFKAEVDKIKPNTYIVGEVLKSSAVYGQYYNNSNIDSFFCFDDVGKLGNNIYQSIISESIVAVNKYINNDITNSSSHIPAPLLGNHDSAAGGRSTKSYLEDSKLVHALLAMGNGATFEYYGDEIGMKQIDGGKDEDIRQPLYWGDSYTCVPVSGSSEGTSLQKYPYGSVKEQENDANSLLNYFSKAYKYRLENPELARGSSEIYYKSDDDSYGIIKREYNGSSLYIAMNLSSSLTGEVDLSKLDVEAVGDLSINDKPYYKGNSLVLPPYSIVLLH